MSTMQRSIGYERAIELADSKWWEGLTAREIARGQLFTEELCCPVRVFHKALEESLGRAVFPHEFGRNLDGIIQEFLDEADAPTMPQIIELIPAAKRILCGDGETDDADGWKGE